MSSNLHTAWARLFVRALVRSGVTHAVVSPGSRSTPLALALAREPGLTVTPVVDERAAGFVALGQARTTGRATMLLCTSGSAGAHWLPAIVEANMARLPLLAVTADRPWDQQHAAASQTIDQRKMFGGFVRESIDLGLPDAGALSAIARLGAHAVQATRHPVPGPVHVNAPFRKPLEPVVVGAREAWEDEAERLMESGPAIVSAADSVVGAAAVERLAAMVRASRRTVIVAGPAAQAAVVEPERAERFARAVAKLAERAGAAVLAEATSGARFGAELAAHVVPCFDAVLRSSAFAGAVPDLAIEIGSPPCSSAYEKCATSSGLTRVIVTDHGLPDPLSSAKEVIVGDPAATLEAVAARLASEPGDTLGERNRWARSLVALGHRADEIAHGLATTWSEAAVARTLLSSLPEHAVLLVGNSLPVREIDRYGGGRRARLAVQHQRGAAGIDGLIAGAVGARIATPANAPVALVLGDVSTLHDVGSFALLAACDAPLGVVVVDNGGGRIFEELPIARTAGLEGTLARFFLTPPPKFVGGVAAAFGVAHARVERVDDLREALAIALAAPRATVIECTVPPDDGRERRARLVAEVEAAARGGLA